MNTQPTRIIFSVERSNASPDANRQASYYAESILAMLEVNFMKVQGVYKGVAETAYLVSMPTYNTPQSYIVNQSIKTLIERYKQEAILVIDPNNRAYLKQANGDKTELGTWRSVTKEEALASDNYTLINGVYFKAGN